MKSLNLKSTSALALALIAGGVVATATPVSADQTTGTVQFTAGNLEFGDGTGQTVPSFDFGIKAITTQDETYNTTAAGILAVTDLRGSSAGWKVTVAQQDQLKTVNNDVLTGASLTLAAGTVTNTNGEDPANTAITLTPDGSSVEVLKAEAGKGNGISKLTWGTDKAKLFVPGSTTKKAAQYTANLEWTLLDSPN